MRYDCKKNFYLPSNLFNFSKSFSTNFEKLKRSENGKLRNFFDYIKSKKVKRTKKIKSKKYLKKYVL